jgi:plasmid maintenance system antidote protein VapI
MMNQWMPQTPSAAVDLDVLDESSLAVAQATIQNAMDEAHLKSARLAEKMGRPRSYVSRMLSGRHNLTVKTFSRALAACGFRLQFATTILAKEKEDKNMYEATHDKTKTEIALTRTFDSDIADLIGEYKRDKAKGFIAKIVEIREASIIALAKNEEHREEIKRIMTLCETRMKRLAEGDLTVLDLVENKNCKNRTHGTYNQLYFDKCPYC